MGEDSGRARPLSAGRSSRRAVLAGLAALVGSPGRAQSVGDTPVTREILAVRDKIRAAIAAKDRAALETLYAENFTHLRDSGRADLKGDRITLLLSGEPSIETAPEEQLAVQVYGLATAVVTGVSPIPDPATKTPALFRWVVVFARDERGWTVALSQASRIPRR